MDQNDVRNKIAKFAELSDGWHYGSGSAPPVHVIIMALEIEAMLRNLYYPETDAFPGADGEVQVCGYRSDTCLTVEISSRQFSKDS